MGVKSECGSRRFRIITAGYPADKTRGTMWRHIAPMTMDMCAAPANKEFGGWWGNRRAVCGVGV